jgi:hypothetical protein
MNHWEFAYYQTEDEQDLTKQWYVAQNADVQAVFDSIVKVLEGTERLDNRKDFLPLKKRHWGLWEIRFSLDGIVKHRPVGFFTLSYHQFVLVLGCSKRGGNYQPLNAFDMALEYRKIFLNEGRGSIHERDF